MDENKIDLLKQLLQLKLKTETSMDYAREKEYYRIREHDSEKLILSSLLYGNAGALSVILAFLGTQADKAAYFSSIKSSLLFLSFGLMFSFLGLVFLNSESSNRVSQFNYLNNKQNYEVALQNLSNDRRWAVLAEKSGLPFEYNDELTSDESFLLKDKINKCNQEAIKFGENADKDKQRVACSLLLSVGSFAIALILQGISLFFGFK